MSKYLIFEMPRRMIEVEASGPDVARRKYNKVLKGLDPSTELVIVPSTNTRVTIDSTKSIPLWRQGIEKIR